ncbi:MAG: 5'/3'-nucleotidase SurE [Geminicoccaceae bacterium]
MAELRRILISNDDGIHATGIQVLERIAAQLADEVWVVAPEANQSGAGHSLTLRRPLRLRAVSDHRYAVDGTPTDCVLVALHQLLKDKPVDLMLSGVNHGGNMAEDMTYSGTIAAAMESTLLGQRAMAFSQVFRDRDPVSWATAETWAPDVIRRCLEIGWAEDTLLNVNFPDRAPDDVRGIRATRQGRREIGEELIERIDPRGDPYIWVGALRGADRHHDGTDVAAVNDGFVSITPIHLDMTHDQGLERLRRLDRG